MLTALCFHGISFGSAKAGIGSYPLPLAESEALITRWLQQKNFSVVADSSASGDIVLSGTAAGKVIRISLRSHSPLSTDIDLLETTGKESLAAVRSSWESFLAKAGQESGSEIPARIKSLADAVVCINSLPAEEHNMNFSGFFIDQQGTVLTIAHDIKDLKAFRLLFPGGKFGEGRMEKSDAAKDLSIIQSDHRGYSKYLPLKDGLSQLRLGDRVYMLCCSKNGSVQIQSGTVDKPKANVDGQALWQVHLEQVFFGSSGSPVVDANGRLVGVVKGRFRGADSRGFLIPVDTARSFVGMEKK
jgi:serine protease Do